MGPRRACAIAAVLLSLAAVPARAGSEPSPAVVGGPLLARTGIVVDRSAGAPALPAVSAAGWVVADAGTGEVLAARNPHGRFRPASTLKTLTAVALLPRLEPSATYVVRRSDVAVEGSKVGLVAGWRYPVSTLFESMLMVSGNDSANALASAVGGMPRAVRLMNDEARRLQANDTLARNTSGLDAPGQLTSAYDLALINRVALASPRLARYGGTKRASMPAPGGRRFETYNHNKLLDRYPGAIGGKTGYTMAARHTYVGAARRGGRTLLVTLLRSERHYPDATSLLDWGFAAAGKVAPVGQLVDPLPAEDSSRQGHATRSRSDAAPHVATAPGPAAAKAVRAGLPVLPVAGGLVALTTVAVARRRVVRRRRRFGPPSTLRLRLPVR